MYIVMFGMYLWVPLYKYKFYSTYGYFCTSISFVTPTGDLNKYKSVISTSRCISLLYEIMKILISANEYLLLLYAYCTRVSMHLYIYKSYVPTKRKA